MQVLKRWLPVVLWSAVILSTSNDYFSATHTQSWLHAPEMINIALRKLAHLTGYGILGALAWSAATPVAALTREARAATGVAALQTYFVVILVASIDEWHQSLFPSRGASPWDVLLDVVGATIAIGIMIRVQQLRSRRRTP